MPNRVAKNTRPVLGSRSAGHTSASAGWASCPRLRRAASEGLHRPGYARLDRPCLGSVDRLNRARRKPRLLASVRLRAPARHTTDLAQRRPNSPPRNTRLAPLRPLAGHRPAIARSNRPRTRPSTTPTRFHAYRIGPTRSAGTVPLALSKRTRPARDRLPIRVLFLGRSICNIAHRRQPLGVIPAKITAGCSRTARVFPFRLRRQPERVPFLAAQPLCEREPRRSCSRCSPGALGLLEARVLPGIPEVFQTCRPLRSSQSRPCRPSRPRSGSPPRPRTAGTGPASLRGYRGKKVD